MCAVRVDAIDGVRWQDVFHGVDLDLVCASWRSCWREVFLREAFLRNASSAALPPQAPDTYFEYGRIHPQLEVDLRWSIVDHLIGRHGVRYVQNWIETTDDSKLSEDMRSESDDVRSLLGGTAPHSVMLFWYGLQWDDRDNEISPHSGSFT